MNFAKQLAALEAKRAALVAANADIMKAAADEGTTLDAEQKTAFDENDADIKEIDGDIKRIKSLIACDAETATPVDGATQEKGSESRAGVTVPRAEVKGANAPKGAAFARFVMASAAAKGNPMMAQAIAEQRKDWDNTPQVIASLKAAVAAGTTDAGNWAQPLTEYQGMAAEFVELLRPATIIGRIEGLRPVPFNTPILIQTGGSLVNWVGETKLKPVGALAFEQAKMDMTKVAGIVVLSDEMVRSSSPDAELSVRNDLTAQVGQFLDEQFVDPAVAEVPGVKPASITNGAGTRATGGNSADAIRAGVNDALGDMIAAGLGVADVVVLANEGTALHLVGLRNALGQREFPDVNVTGGLLDGRPMLTSQSIPLGTLIFVKASEVMIADDGSVTIDASKEATLVMDNAPADGAAPTFNLWQRNAIGIRAERFINWKRRRAAAVQVVTGVGTSV